MSEERDASADAASDEGSTDKTCERCGAGIETSEWYPVTADRSEDGSLELYPFCSEECQTAWRGAHSE